MKKIAAAALCVIGIFPASLQAAEANLTGTWTLTFATTPVAFEITMSFLEVTVFFVGTSGQPDNCTWAGVDLPLIGQSSVVTGVMTCGVPEPTLVSLLFATATNRDMTGVIISPSLTPPITTFEGVTERNVTSTPSKR